MSMGRKFADFIYFFFTLSLSFANFVPLLINHNSKLTESITFYTFAWYLTCFVVSVPFICEHIVDSVITSVFPKYQDLKHSRRSLLDQILLLIAPFLSIIVICISQYHEVSSFVGHSLTAFSHSLIVCGVYSQLIESKTTNKSSFILSLTALCCIVSEVCLTQNAVSSDNVCLQAALAFGVFSVCAQLYSTYKWVTSPTDLTSTSYTAYSLIMPIYLLIRVVFLSILTASPHSQFDSNQQLVVRIAVLIVVYLMCAMVPGRLARGAVMSLKNEIETKKTFIRYISHEIRSPLSTTSLGLDYLLDQFACNPEISTKEVHEVVRDAKITCEIATSTLNDLLMFDKMETGMLQATKVECNARDFVLKCVRPFQLQAQVHDIALTCLTDGLPDDVQEQCESNILLCVDSPKIEQVVRNFLTNALKFTSKDGQIQVRMVVVERPPLEEVSNKNKGRRQSATVHVGLPPPMQLMLRVEVVDTGPGISAENLPKLFGQYVQFDANTLQGGKGSGLGLWLSKAIVEMHGGVIGATSPGQGQGCTFFMELPCINADPDLDAEVDVRSVESVMPTIRSPVSIKRSPINKNTSISDKTGVGEYKSLSPFSHKEECEEGLKTLRLMSPQSTKANSPFSTASVTPIKNSRGFGLTNSGKVVRLPPLSSFSPPRISPAAPPPAVEKSGRTFLRNIARILPQPSQLMVTSVPSTPKPLDSNSEPSSISIRRYDTEGRSVRSLANSINTVPVTDLKVLIVDDSALARKMVERSIASVCRVCHHANNGLEALQMVSESQNAQGEDEDIERPRDPPYDVILMDYYMPVMSGPEAARKIRDAGFQGVILGVTGNTAGVEHANMTAAGADRVLVKPFSVEAFKLIVAEMRSRAM